MFDTFGRPTNVSRRRFLAQTSVQVGALGTLSIGSFARGETGKSSVAPKAKRAMMIFLAGGASHFETFDPKPDAPLEFRGPFNAISTKLPGIQFSENLRELSKLNDQFSLVRSVCHENSGHGGGQRQVQTGYKSASLEDELPHDYPAVGSVVAKMRGAMSGGMPTYMHLPNGDDGGAKFLGNAYDAFQVYSTGLPVGIQLRSSVKLDRLESRVALRKSLDRMARVASEGRAMESMDQLERQALEMITSPSAADAFELDKEPEAMRMRYGKHEAGRCLLLARRFLEAGAGIVTVRMGSWDHHGNAGGTVTSGTLENVPPLDQSLSAFLTDMTERGMLDDTIVWVWGEFGRTPRINNSAGRDHWPQAMSVLLAGGGIQPGHVIGSTTSKGEHPADSPFSPADVLATVYKQLGIDTSHQFLNTAGRPISILAEGKPIRELL